MAPILAFQEKRRHSENLAAWPFQPPNYKPRSMAAPGCREILLREGILFCGVCP